MAKNDEALLVNPSVEELEDRIVPLFLQHGTHHFASHTILQDGLNYFVMDGVGYIAFLDGKFGGTQAPLTLGPVCSEENLPDLILGFEEQIRKPIRYDPSFFYVDEPTARALHDLGYKVNQCGKTTTLDLTEWNTEGPLKGQLRRSRNKAQKEGITVEEVLMNDVNMGELQRTVDKWMDQKIAGGEEFHFLARPLVYGDELVKGDEGILMKRRDGLSSEGSPLVRKFIARDNQGEIIGVSVYDPIIKDGEIIGYIESIRRSSIQTAAGIQDVITLHAIDQFRSENRNFFSLGPSVLYKIDDKGEFDFDRFVQWNLEFSYRNWGQTVFNYATLAYHKSIFRGKEEQIYFASRKPGILSTNDLLAAYYATNIPLFGKLLKGWKEEGKNPYPHLGSELVRNNLFLGKPSNKVAIIDGDSKRRNEIANRLWKRYRVVEYNTSSYQGVGGAVRELTHDTAALVISSDISGESTLKGVRSLVERGEKKPIVLYGTVSKQPLDKIREAIGRSHVYQIASTDPKEVYFEVGIALQGPKR
ncbi:phosphatidylglycerol lysyltransferase domain-containing protein [Nanoarchaeota archaeon]